MRDHPESPKVPPESPKKPPESVPVPPEPVLPVVVVEVPVVVDVVGVVLFVVDVVDVVDVVGVVDVVDVVDETEVDVVGVDAVVGQSSWSGPGPSAGFRSSQSPSKIAYPSPSASIANGFTGTLQAVSRARQARGRRDMGSFPLASILRC